ncbi:MAG: hypothetical protein M1168_01945 [Candidatus Marsarchaeota archaeon]|nr:hypothetical protein [Candidatus Marsarchaeota archaeon]MCL5094722.1 hypothetical protein [Candidatus Marsarchaeota archaeon]
MDSFNISYETIWQIYYKEKQTNELQLLPKTFYEDIDEFIKTFEKNQNNIENIDIKQNISSLVTKIFEKRKQKILIYSAYNKSLPQPIPDPESNFYNKIYELKKIYVLDVPEQNQKIQLKIIAELPEIILPSGQKLGPLNKNEIIKINSSESEDINYLINNSICIKI